MQYFYKYIFCRLICKSDHVKTPLGKGMYIFKNYILLLFLKNHFETHFSMALPKPGFRQRIGSAIIFPIRSWSAITIDLIADHILGLTSDRDLIADHLEISQITFLITFSLYFWKKWRITGKEIAILYIFKSYALNLEKYILILQYYIRK